MSLLVMPCLIIISAEDTAMHGTVPDTLIPRTLMINTTPDTEGSHI